MKRILFSFVLAGACLSKAATITENFDDIATLTARGWAVVNASTNTTGAQSWFQGNPALFPAENGAPNSYIAANFLAEGGVTGNVSLWLLTPQLTFNNGDRVSFFTRTVTGAVPGDQLELRFSANGASTNVGATDTSVGDFTNLLSTVNTSRYPENWTQFSSTLSGLSGPTLGRLGFHYSVIDVATHGDYIGIDALSVTAPEPGSAALLALSLAGLLIRRAKHFQVEFWRRGETSHDVV